VPSLEEIYEGEASEPSGDHTDKKPHNWLYLHLTKRSVCTRCNIELQTVCEAVKAAKDNTIPIVYCKVS